MTMQQEVWKITLVTTKRNVFFSLSDSHNKVQKLVTPGLFHKPGVNPDEYKKLNDRRDRRKKRSLRLFLNNQKKTPPAYTKAWNLLKTYITSQKLEDKKFILILSGSNIKLSKTLGRLFLRSTKINIIHIVIRPTNPHNGCPLKIKKRKKNKGRNKWKKKLLMTAQHKLPVARGIWRTRRIPGSVTQKDIQHWYRQRLEDAFFLTPRVAQAKTRLKHSNVKPVTQILVKGISKTVEKK